MVFIASPATRTVIVANQDLPTRQLLNTGSKYFQTHIAYGIVDEYIRIMHLVDVIEFRPFIRRDTVGWHVICMFATRAGIGRSCDFS